MSHHEFFGRLSGILIAISVIPYIIAILRGQTKPNKASWIVWAVMGAALLFTYRDSGAKESIWAAVAGFINPTLIALLALKYGTPGWTRLDKACLFGAALSFVIWKAFNQPVVALTAAIITDCFGAIPTLRKSWREPATEDPIAWGLFPIASLLNVLAIEQFSYATLVYPLYMGLASWSIAFPIVRHHWFTKRPQPA